MKTKSPTPKTHLLSCPKRWIKKEKCYCQYILTLRISKFMAVKRLEEYYEI